MPYSRDRAWTVRVGEGPWTARYTVRTPAEVCSFLGRLVLAARDSMPAAAAPPTAGSHRRE